MDDSKQLEKNVQTFAERVKRVIGSWNPTCLSDTGEPKNDRAEIAGIYRSIFGSFNLFAEEFLFVQSEINLLCEINACAIEIISGTEDESKRYMSGRGILKSRIGCIYIIGSDRKR